MPQIKTDIMVNLPIQARRGDTFKMQLLAEIGTTKTRYDFTGYTARLQIKKSPKRSNEAPILELTTENSGITLTAGLIQLYGSPTKMLFPAGSYVYDFQITYPGGDIWTWFGGSFTLTQDVTQ